MSATPPSQMLPPLLRLPMELKTAIAELVVLHHKADGMPATMTILSAQMMHKKMFSLPLINKEFWAAFGTLALAYHTFRLQITSLQHPGCGSGHGCALFSTGRTSSRVRRYGIIDTGQGQFDDDLCFRIELPPPAARQHIQHLEIVLQFPNDMSEVLDRGWLYPARKPEVLGFTNLKTLMIKVDETKVDRKTVSARFLEAVEAYVDDRVTEMGTERTKVEHRFMR